MTFQLEESDGLPSKVSTSCAVALKTNVPFKVEPFRKEIVCSWTVSKTSLLKSLCQNKTNIRLSGIQTLLVRSLEVDSVLLRQIGQTRYEAREMLSQQKRRNSSDWWPASYLHVVSSSKCRPQLQLIGAVNDTATVFLNGCLSAVVGQRTPAAATDGERQASRQRKRHVAVAAAVLAMNEKHVPGVETQDLVQSNPYS